MLSLSNVYYGKGQQLRVIYDEEQWGEKAFVFMDDINSKAKRIPARCKTIRMEVNTKKELEAFARGILTLIGAAND